MVQKSAYTDTEAQHMPMNVSQLLLEDMIKQISFSVSSNMN